MECISISRNEVSGSLKNYQGTIGECVAAFSKDCKKAYTEWGHLLDERDGSILAMYSKTYGLQVGSRRSSFNQCDEG